MTQREMLEEIRRFLEGYWQGFTCDSPEYRGGSGGTAFMVFWRGKQGLRVEFTQETLKDQSLERIISRLKAVHVPLEPNVAFRVSEESIDEIPWTP